MQASSTGTVSLEESYAQCVAVTRERAKNFHYAFKVLPAERYKSICALYAFTRTADDLSDDEADAAKALANSQSWRSEHHLDIVHVNERGADLMAECVAKAIHKEGVINGALEPQGVGAALAQGVRGAVAAEKGQG